MNLREAFFGSVLLFDLSRYQDDRGYLYESFRQSSLAREGIDFNPVQTNTTYSVKNTLRGLHYQLPPHAQAKLIMVVKGAIFDVVVDLRRGSPEFGKWVSIQIEEQSPQLLYIPKGFAHGFYVLSEEAYVLYQCDDYYTPDLERGLTWNDPALSIDWPVSAPLLSEKDQNNPTLAELDLNELPSIPT